MSKKVKKVLDNNFKACIMNVRQSQKDTNKAPLNEL